MVLYHRNLGFLFLISLFNFQGPCCSLFFRDSLKSISYSFSLVNTFSKLFSSFFVSTFFAPPQLLPKQQRYSITSFRLCQQFFVKKFGYFAEMFFFWYSLPGVFEVTGSFTTIYCVFLHFNPLNTIWGIRKKTDSPGKVCLFVTLYGLIMCCTTSTYRVYFKKFPKEKSNLIYEA